MQSPQRNHLNANTSTRTPSARSVLHTDRSSMPTDSHGSSGPGPQIETLPIPKVRIPRDVARPRVHAATPKFTSENVLGGSRTCNLRLRRPTLYPVELRALAHPSLRKGHPILSQPTHRGKASSSRSRSPGRGGAPASRRRPPFTLHDTIDPAEIPLLGPRTITFRAAPAAASLGTSLAASSIPRDSSPRITRGARFATITICCPTNCSGV